MEKRTIWDTKHETIDDNLINKTAARVYCSKSYQHYNIRLLKRIIVGNQRHSNSRTEPKQPWSHSNQMPSHQQISETCLVSIKRADNRGQNSHRSKSEKWKIVNEKFSMSAKSYSIRVKLSH